MLYKYIFKILNMKTQINKILALGVVTEIELAQMMFPRHRYPILVLDSVRNGRELKASEITMLEALSRAQIMGQFFSIPLAPGTPGLWLRCKGYEIALMGDEALFYKSGVIIDRYAYDNSNTIEAFLLDCLTIIKKLKENE